MKNTIIIIILVLVSITGLRAQTIDSAFTKQHKMVTAQIIPIKATYFDADSAKYLSLGTVESDYLSYISFNWTIFSSSGLPLKSQPELVDGIDFLNLKNSIHATNSSIPILTWIGERYNFKFK